MFLQVMDYIVGYDIKIVKISASLLTYLLTTNLKTRKSWELITILIVNHCSFRKTNPLLMQQ